jgi:hypothetical protein
MRVQGIDDLGDAERTACEQHRADHCSSQCEPAQLLHAHTGHIE